MIMEKELARYLQRITLSMQAHPDNKPNSEFRDYVNGSWDLLDRYENTRHRPASNQSCKMCKGKKEIEVIVMGTDTDWVECPKCSLKRQ